MKPSAKAAMQTTQKKPKKTYDHVYAVIRIDDFQGVNAPTESKITIKAILWDAESAKEEADRLNNLQTGEGVRYIVQITRLERKESPPHVSIGLPTVINNTPIYPVGVEIMALIPHRSYAPARAGQSPCQPVIPEASGPLFGRR